MGPANPHYKTGITSMVLPERMREGYEAALADEELLSLRSEIAVIDSRIIDLLGKVDTGESGKRWQELRAQVKLVNSAPDGLELRDQLRALTKMITAGSVDAFAWAEIERFMLTRERLVRSERKRLVEARLVVSMDSAQLAMAMFVDAAKEAVGNDPDVMGKIVDAFIRISGYNAAALTAAHTEEVQ